jgi:hypothetical protein
VLPLFRSLLLSLRSFGSSLRLLLHLPVPSVVPSLFYKALSTQYVTNLVRVPFIVCVQDIPVLLDSDTS